MEKWIRKHFLSCFNFKFEIEILFLHENERVNRGEGTLEWANYLLDIGNGSTDTDEDGLIALPDSIIAESDTVDDFIREIYPHLGKPD